MKSDRQVKILELIREQDVETQEELSDLLRKAGYQVTQATVSRDIRELKLTKVSVNGSRQKYVSYSNRPESMSNKYVTVLREGFVSIDAAMNLIVIKTVSGMAMAVAAALDAMEWPEIMGCIAGDDTIMCALHNENETSVVRERILKIVEG
jgi:transcriptional regulator of arginine metabolism